MDKDKSGRIDTKEFKLAMQNLKIPVGVKEIDDIFAVYDEDGNGLDYYEFIDIISTGKAESKGKK